MREALTEAGDIDVDVLLRVLNITKAEFARAIGLAMSDLAQTDRLASRQTQQRLCEILDVLGWVQGWTGSFSTAWSWYRSQPIPALGDRVAEDLVASNRADEVRAYIAQTAEGGYA